MELEPAPVRVLTIGDGDCSFSLALARAFGAQILLTVTTLPDESELNATYKQFAANLAELRATGVKVVFGVDATAIPSDLGPQDHICFLHPHLGLSDLLDEAAHAKRHSVLVAHYLSSAKRLLTPGRGCIHLTLCGNQPRTWECEAHASRLRLALVQQQPTSYHASFFPPSVRVLQPEQCVRDEWGARRKFRSGALGSKHWAGRYGYEHRRCENDDDMRVEQSVEMIFVPLADHDAERASAERCAVVPLADPGAAEPASGWRCAVCGVEIAAGEQPDEHVTMLAMPTLTPQERAWRDETTGKTFRTQFELASFRVQQEHLAKRRAAPEKQTALSEAAQAAAAAKEAASASAAAKAAAMLASSSETHHAGASMSVGDGGDGGDGGGSSFSRLSHVVPTEGEGQRAFVWVRRGAFASQLASKSQATTAFKEKRVLLGGTPIEETRRLKAGETLELLHDPLAAHRMRATGQAATPVVIHLVREEIAVVWSAGMRRAGDYPGTLQSVLRTLLPPSTQPAPPVHTQPLAAPYPISRTEATCAGLTLIARTRHQLEALNDLAARSLVSHSFVAMLIGRVPDEWGHAPVSLELPAKASKGFRRAKRAARAAAAATSSGAPHAEGEAEEEDDDDEAGEEEDNEDAVGAAHSAASGAPPPPDGTLLKAEPVHVTRLSVTDEGLPFALSTVRLECAGRSGRLCGDLCYLMRSLGYPVVGDRYAKRESASLPRYASALKGKLQMGCYAVTVRAADGADPLEVCEVPVPARLMAVSWSSHEAASRAKLEGAPHEMQAVS